jgi:hypothetical protein
MVLMALDAGFRSRPRGNRAVAGEGQSERHAKALQHAGQAVSGEFHRLISLFRVFMTREAMG